MRKELEIGDSIGKRAHRLERWKQAVGEIDGLVEEHLIVLARVMVRREQPPEDADRDLYTTTAAKRQYAFYPGSKSPEQV